MIFNNLTDDVINNSSTSIKSEFIGLSIAAAPASIPNNAYTSITFTSQQIDTHNFWTSGTNIVIPEGYGGVYYMFSHLGGPSGSFGGTVRVGIFINGANNVNGGITDENYMGGNAMPFIMRNLNEGDIITVRLFQNTGASRTCGGGQFSMFRVGSL